jgi:hypothetical protein
MTPSYIHSNLSRFNGDIATVKSRNLTYVLGETSSFACHGAPGGLFIHAKVDREHALLRLFYA